MEVLLTWQLLTILSILSWVFLARFSLLTSRLRSSLQPVVSLHVHYGIPLVLRIQSMQHQSLDALFGALSVLVSKEFYTAFLPFLFWSGHCRLARQMTLLMAFSLYVGNCVKDIISAPRPPCPPVRRFTSTESEKDFALEYGLPSSHTINTICLSGYLLMYVMRHYDVGGTYTAMLMFFFFTVTILTILGRLYLGMHTPIDVFAGVFLGICLLALWCSIDESLDSFIINGKNVPSFWASISFLLLFAYPTPELPTPSFASHTAFNGVALGVVLGVHRTYSQYHHENMANLIGLHQVPKRLVVGFPVVLAVKFMSKELAKILLPTVCSCIGIPVKSSSYSPGLHMQDTSVKDGRKLSSTQEAFFGTGIQKPSMAPFDIDTGVRLLQYAGLGWSVVELAPYVFASMGL